MAEIKIKEGSAIIEFWDDNDTVFVAQFPNAVFRNNSVLWVGRWQKDNANKVWKLKGQKVNLP